MHNQETGLEFRYHHLGIPTNITRPGERYSEKFKMYTSDNEGTFNIQFHRFENDSPLHPIIKSLPHVALQVNNLSKAIEGKELLLGPYEPIEGYQVAIINDRGVPVEFIQTDLSAEELWKKALSS